MERKSREEMRKEILHQRDNDDFKGLVDSIKEIDKAMIIRKNQNDE